MPLSAQSALNREVYMLNENLENYFENTIIPQLYVDAALVLRKFTPPAMKQFTLSHADIGKNMHEVVDNIRYATLIENITEVIDTGVILEKEVQTTDKRWFQMNILPYIVRKQNKPNGVIITFVDITSRITALKDLEKVNADHNTFIYAVSHDIKQPLSIIALMAEVLQDAFDKNNSKQFLKGIETLNRSARNMKEILNDFTEHIKVKAEKSPENERLNIENICEDVILALKDEIHHKGVSITASFKTSEIQFSRKNARSIVYNLIHNAIKYKSADKPLQIIIKTKKIKDYVLLTIQDNGLGIDKEHHKMIFKKFTRIDSIEEGTGLGLYIVSSMMENNGGKIEVKSVPGEGSTFKVYFKNNFLI
jgi:Signal transduction histidine kinase